MEKKTLFFFFLLLLLLDTSNGVVEDNPPSENDLTTYIIQLIPPANMTLTTAAARERWYFSFLPWKRSAAGRARVVHLYNNAFTGFAARLTEAELDSIRNLEGFVQAIPDKKLPLHTTRSPGFLGLFSGEGFWSGVGYGEGVVIGVLDSGFTPGHPSFHGDGMPPPPRGRRSCDSPKYCNNKVIGARSFTRDTVVDVDGHGTHTASTAAGAFVPGATVNGLANGTASGVAPRAHLSIYKVCDLNFCRASDVLAGIDAAVADGVDILSISLGGDFNEYFTDPIAMGALRATRKGIVVVCSAGNNGVLGLSNEAPWVISVGAATLDRRFLASLRLGDNSTIQGEAVNQHDSLAAGVFPVVFPGANNSYAAYCESGSLNDVKGKLVVCVRGGRSSRVEKGKNVKLAGGAGMILTNRYIDGGTILAEFHALPAIAVGYVDGSRVKRYITSTKTPNATIFFHGTEIGTRPSPAVSSFSSKGPARRSPLVLKPDVIAPGVNVMAAIPSFTNTPSSLFGVLSGTSMAAPHVSGLAALLKAAHPEWSPSAIRSALVTTSVTVGNDGKAIVNEYGKAAAEYEMGAGLPRVAAAADVGLVYETAADEYVAMLCGLGYSDADVGAVVGEAVSCTVVGTAEQWEVNYPSVTVPSRRLPLTVRRTVRNVGGEGVYVVEVKPPANVDVEVQPRMMRFKRQGERRSFNVTFRAAGTVKAAVGSMRWISGDRVVRSPLIVYV